MAASHFDAEPPSAPGFGLGMTDLSREPPRRRIPIGLLALGAAILVNGAAWLYFRARQPATDEITRDRLRPRRRA